MCTYIYIFVEIDVCMYIYDVCIYLYICRALH